MILTNQTKVGFFFIFMPKIVFSIIPKLNCISAGSSTSAIWHYKDTTYSISKHALCNIKDVDLLHLKMFTQ